MFNLQPLTCIRGDIVSYLLTSYPKDTPKGKDEIKLTSFSHGAG
jgi:hypothetical protein